MDMLFFWLGLIVLVIAGLGFLIATFRAGILWGLACLILPPASLVFLVAHWGSAKGPFGLQIVGVLMMCFGLYQAGFFQSQQGLVQFNQAALQLSSAQASANPAVIDDSDEILIAQQPASRASQSTQRFQCDGRTYCTQMTSLAEARFFTRNCPNTKMDGNHDGEPCESDSRRGRDPDW